MESLVVLIDKSKIAQVIRNLVSNALKFSPKGSDVTVRAFTLFAPERLVVCTSQGSKSVHPGTIDVENGGKNGAGLETLNGTVLRIEVKDYGTGLSQVYRENGMSLQQFKLVTFIFRMSSNTFLQKLCSSMQRGSRVAVDQDWDCGSQLRLLRNMVAKSALSPVAFPARDVCSS